MAEYFEGIGRRKEATARVRVSSGKGDFMINGKPLEEFFPRFGDVQIVLSPLEDAGAKGSVDVSVLVKGGGITGQVGAVRMGIARAMLKMNPDVDRAMMIMTLPDAQYLFSMEGRFTELVLRTRNFRGAGSYAATFD